MADYLADDANTIAVRLRAYEEQRRGYCKNRDPDKNKLGNNHECWCYILIDEGKTAYPCPPRPEEQK